MQTGRPLEFAYDTPGHAVFDEPAGKTAGDVFDAHAEVMDAHGMRKHRLNACGYAMGAKYTPSWMDFPMFYHGNDVVLRSRMVFFAHMIAMDSDAGCAMTLGRSYIVDRGAPEALSKHSLNLIVR